MADLLGMSARIIDEGIDEGPGVFNRVNRELSEVGDGVAVVEAFSHVISFDTGDGLVLFDTSLEGHARPIIESLRKWRDAPIDTIAFTHGHVDHIGGAKAFVDHALDRGDRRPRFVAHENVDPRIDRYTLTSGYNKIINWRQFAMSRGKKLEDMDDAPFGPTEWVRPDTTFREKLSVRVGDDTIEMRHDKGETDDHLWAWLPERKAICAGDFLIWMFPNAGNPQKAQRYPLEWAHALRQMQAMGAELLLPAHGLPIAGRKRISEVLDNMARALEGLVEETLKLMNQGAKLNDIIHSVHVPADLLEKPYLRPMYDEPEFVVQNIWRLYGGWYDGNPANLKPARDAELAEEITRLAGGAPALGFRARELSEAGQHRLACHLAEIAAAAAPDSTAVHKARAKVYAARRDAELSLMSKGIYGAAAAESAGKVEE
ncbi:alkyl sulfatase dimerization domain-containing protein [Minwuia sp.]|uniref:alkyl sulfatase dimerization domain-containing protein n=1 Tax=Minwuia sp. TaxID=2493630 RepID=UPI003A8E1E66